MINSTSGCGYTVYTDTHCGGDSIDSLEDGTAYGWQPGDAGVEACEELCTLSLACHSFVWRDSDNGCFWKSSVTVDTHLGDYPGHDCYMWECDEPGKI